MLQIELSRIPLEGLTQRFHDKSKRDMVMANLEKLDFEVQPWRTKIKGDWRYGFSYNKTYHLTLKQKKELKKLEEQEALVSTAILGIQFRRALKEMQDDLLFRITKEEYEQREWCPEGLEEKKKGGTK